MADIATSLETALGRVITGVADDVAQLGLKALRDSLDAAGFRKMENLKDYEVFSHVSGDTILFEIVLDVEGVEALPEDKLEQAGQNAEILESEIDNLVFRTYGLTKGGDVARISRMKDGRRPVTDARRPARDARKGAGGALEREAAHKVAKSAPRSLAGMKGIRVTKEGKLSLSFQRSVTAGPNGEAKFPSTQFEGVLQDFMDKLKKVITDVFVPELEAAVARYVR